MSKKSEQIKKQQRKREREGQKKKKQQSWIIMSSTIVVLLLVVLIVSIVFQNSHKAATRSVGSASPTANSMKSGKSVIQYKNEPAMGDPNAPLKVAEFGDYKCPICKAFELQVFPKLKQDYIDTGKVQFYFMNYPIIDQNSLPAANASEAIYEEHPNEFWTFHQLLYENQGDETKAWVTESLLVKLAKQAVPNLNVKPFQWEISQKTYEDQVNRDKLMGERAGVNGTPTLFINGTIVNSAPLDYASLKAQIDQALKKAGK